MGVISATIELQRVGRRTCGDERAALQHVRDVVTLRMSAPGRGATPGRRMVSARWIAVSLYAACLATTGCTGDDTNPALPPAADAAPPTPDATTADGNAPDAEPPPLPIALVRVANWSPDAPAVDFCLAAHGTTAFQGPLLGHASALLDAAAPPLGYPDVSAYVQVPPGQYDVRAVVAGASDCSAGIGADLTSAPSLGIGTFATLALLGKAQGGAPGSGGAKLQLAAFVDEGVSSGKVALRFVNAAAAPEMGSADFGTGTAGASFKPISKSVAFGAVGAIPDAGGVDGGIKADSHGYAIVPALASATLSAHATGSATDAVVARGVTIAAGAVVTAALLVAPAVTDDGGATFQLLECVDNAGTVGVTGSCTVIGP
jgi:hypothetical protein